MDAALFGASAVLWGSVLVGNQYLSTPTAAEAGAPLDPAGINGLDRLFLSPYRYGSDLASQFTVYTTILLPAGFLFSREIRAGVLILMYAETLLLTSGLTQSVKTFLPRYRPYAYDPDAPPSLWQSRDSARSFFSGHSSQAFAAASLTSTLHRKLYPGHRRSLLVDLSAYGLASLTAVLRITAGKHFLTDVLVGALIGTAVGRLVPRWHERTDGPVPVILPHPEGGVLLRWTLSVGG